MSQGRRKDIDEALDEMLAEAKPHVPFTQPEIARRCRISPATVAQYERRALIKVRRFLHAAILEMQP